MSARLDEYQRHHRQLRRASDKRRGAGPAHPLILAVVQWLIHALRPHPIRRRLYPVQRWALMNHYQHTCGRS